MKKNHVVLWGGERVEDEGELEVAPWVARQAFEPPLPALYHRQHFLGILHRHTTAH